MQHQINPLSETHLIIYFGTTINPELAITIAAIANKIRTQLNDVLIEVLPSYTSILIEFNPIKIEYNSLNQQLVTIINQPLTTIKTAAKIITLPSYYALETGPDLKAIAQQTQLTMEQIIQLHSQTQYRVCAIGFSPGFAFLANLSKKIVVKRHNKPRKLIPAGSIGIANEQTAVYPSASPGGWQIIGNCPLPLFTPESSPMTPFTIGDKIKFEPINRQQFLQMGGSICKDWR